MNVLSLFDGMSCGQLALNKSNIKYDVYYASEINKNSIKVTLDNYPNTIELGDINFWKNWDIDYNNIDLIFGGSPCFATGELVMTPIGYKSIENIVVGDMVLTHKGRFRKVLKTGQSYKQIWEVKGMGNPGIKTTKEHPFFTREMYRKWNNNKRTSERHFNLPEWINVNKLTINHYCGITHDKPKIHSEYTEKFWYMIGRYTSDGWCGVYKRKHRKNSYTYRFNICCGKHEFDELKLIFAESGYNYNYTETRTTYEFRICSQKLTNFVEPIGKGASNKVIHPLLFSETVENIKAFLNGYFDSDGCYVESNKEYKATSTSKKLILGIQYLITKSLNFKTSLEHIKRPSTYIIENRTINQKNYYRVSYRDSVRIQDHGFYENGYAWLPIKKVTNTEKFETVYNLEVEEDNSYTINNFVVHNCQGFSFAGKQLNFNDFRSKLFFVASDIINHIKFLNPNVKFLLENVKMKQEYKDVISSYLGVEPIEINSSLLSAQNRPRNYWTNIENITIPNNLGITFNDIRDLQIANYRYVPEEKTINRIYKTNYVQYDINGKGHGSQDQRAYYLNGKHGCLDTGASGKAKVIEADEKIRYITRNEAERLQTVPDNYTKIVSENCAKNLLGNGWTVDVIAHMLKNLKF